MMPQSWCPMSGQYCLSFLKNLLVMLPIQPIYLTHHFSRACVQSLLKCSFGTQNAYVSLFMLLSQCKSHIQSKRALTLSSDYQLIYKKLFNLFYLEISVFQIKQFSIGIETVHGMLRAGEDCETDYPCLHRKGKH